MTTEERVAFERPTPEVSALTDRYYRGLSKLEAEFDAEAKDINPASFQSPDFHSIPCVRKFLEATSALMRNYLHDRQELLGICDISDLFPTARRVPSPE